MPSGTFFRLPEEKRRRLTEAAWNEFTRVKYSDTSINRIIQEAGIPRGSFYQYFEDKQDVLRFLLEDIGEYFFNMFDSAFSSAKGDLRNAALMLFDSIMKEDGAVDSALHRFLQLMAINPGFDLQQIIAERPEALVSIFRRNVKQETMRRGDDEYICRVCQLYIKIIASAIMETLGKICTREIARKNMETDLDILQFGMLSATAAER